MKPKHGCVDRPSQTPRRNHRHHAQSLVREEDEMRDDIK